MDKLHASSSAQGAGGGYKGWPPHSIAQVCPFPPPPHSGPSIVESQSRFPMPLTLWVFLVLFHNTVLLTGLKDWLPHQHKSLHDGWIRYGASGSVSEGWFSGRPKVCVHLQFHNMYNRYFMCLAAVSPNKSYKDQPNAQSHSPIHFKSKVALSFMGLFFSIRVLLPFGADTKLRK